jgi:hypothetical protein
VTFKPKGSDLKKSISKSRKGYLKVKFLGILYKKRYNSMSFASETIPGKDFDFEEVYDYPSPRTNFVSAQKLKLI